MRRSRHHTAFFRPGRDLAFHDDGGTVEPTSLLDDKTRRAIHVGRTRLAVVATLIGLGFTVVSGRLIDVMVLTERDVSAKGAPVAASSNAPISRANIIDRNGVILATNLPTVDLYADSRIIREPQQAASKLLAVLPDLDLELLEKQLASGRAFVYLDRSLTPRQQQTVNSLGLPGINFRKSERRIAVQGPLFSHVLGDVNLAGSAGVSGVERFFNKRLESSPKPLQLSLDSRVQFAMRSILLKAMEHFHAVAAVGMIMDARSGEMIAMISLPDFDPQGSEPISSDARFNRATLGVYEVGSIFKIFNTALALESGTINAEKKYDTVHPVKVGRFTIHDFHRRTRWLDVAEILIQSSNIGSARLAAEIGSEAQKHFLKSLGLFDRTEVELPEVSAPLIPNPWGLASTMTVSFGHGIAVTHLNVAQAVAAMVNGGWLRTPTLIKGVRNQPTRVVSDKTSRSIRRLLRLCVTDGTSSKAEVPGYNVGAKTGTAEKVAATGGYDKARVRGSAVGIFPINDPQYVVLVTLDEPKAVKGTHGFHTAGWNAAPTLSETIKTIGPILGVYPSVRAPAPYLMTSITEGTG